MEASTQAVALWLVVHRKTRHRVTGHYFMQIAIFHYQSHLQPRCQALCALFLGNFAFTPLSISLTYRPNAYKSGLRNAFNSPGRCRIFITKIRWIACSQPKGKKKSMGHRVQAKKKHFNALAPPHVRKSIGKGKEIIFCSFSA
jgi:hypothetical protein